MTALGQLLKVETGMGKRIVTSSLLLLGAVAIVVGSFIGTNFLMDSMGPSCRFPATKIALSKPFIRVKGNAYFKDKLPEEGDTPTAATASAYVLCEDSKIIGKAHSVHVEIETDGKGRYSHWGNTLLFSASDNSDPNTNGRTYFLVK